MADLLVVDDDRDVADLMVAFLELEGHTVRCAHDGEKGLALLAERLPDLVVLDVEMPLLDGPGMATRMLVENCGKETIPILLVSGAVDLAAIAERVGTPYSLAKPFDPAALIALSALALRERRPPAPHAPPRRGLNATASNRMHRGPRATPWRRTRPRRPGLS